MCLFISFVQSFSFPLLSYLIISLLSDIHFFFFLSSSILYLTKLHLIHFFICCLSTFFTKFFVQSYYCFVVLIFPSFFPSLFLLFSFLSSISLYYAGITGRLLAVLAANNYGRPSVMTFMLCSVLFFSLILYIYSIFTEKVTFSFNAFCSV
jgi:hypothetical protein